MIRKNVMLDDESFEQLKKQSGELGMNHSEYIRHLIATQAGKEVSEGDGGWIRKRMDVNELGLILTEHYGSNTSVIKGVEVADFNGQANPQLMRVDVGGVLTLHIDIYEEPFKDGD